MCCKACPEEVRPTDTIALMKEVLADVPEQYPAKSQTPRSSFGFADLGERVADLAVDHGHVAGASRAAVRSATPSAHEHSGAHRPLHA